MQSSDLVNRPPTRLSQSGERAAIEESLAKPVLFTADQLDQSRTRRLSWRRRVLAKWAAGRTVVLERHMADQVKVADNQQVGRYTNRLSSWLRPTRDKKVSIFQSDRSVRWSESSTWRGKYGESLVHVLLVNQTNEHLILLLLLLQLYPSLLYDVFVSQKFKGLGCLHLTIAYENSKLLEYLVKTAKLAETNSRVSSADLLLEQPVTGSLFGVPDFKTWQRESVKQPQPGRGWLKTRRAVAASLSEHASGSGSLFWCDRHRHWPTANGQDHLILFDQMLAKAGVQADLETKLSRLPIYLGDTPLAWAVSFKRRQAYEILSSHVNQNSQDECGYGNIHRLVINDQTGWVRFVVKSGAKLSLECRAGLTPLLLACHLGRSKLFAEILELSAIEFWSYSMVRCCGYPLTNIDSMLVQPGSGRPSAMSTILDSRWSDNEQKSQLLSSTVVKRLLEEKWRTFGKRLFYHELFQALAHLFLMTLAISLRPAAVGQVDAGSWPTSSWRPADWMHQLLTVNRNKLVGRRKAKRERVVMSNL